MRSILQEFRQLPFISHVIGMHELAPTHNRCTSHMFDSCAEQIHLWQYINRALHKASKCMSFEVSCSYLHLGICGYLAKRCKLFPPMFLYKRSFITHPCHGLNYQHQYVPESRNAWKDIFLQIHFHLCRSSSLWRQ